MKRSSFMIIYAVSDSRIAPFDNIEETAKEEQWSGVE